jgi:Flp pilus assembly pilin Flp
MHITRRAVKQRSLSGRISLFGEGNEFMLKTGLNNFLHTSEKGQDLAEYSMLIGLIALLVVVSLTIIGGSINNIFNAIAVAIQNGV